MEPAKYTTTAKAFISDDELEHLQETIKGILERGNIILESDRNMLKMLQGQEHGITRAQAEFIYKIAEFRSKDK